MSSILFPLRRSELASAGGFGPFVQPRSPPGFFDRILIPRWYVDPGLAGGNNDGSSWANAFNNASTAWDDAITASSAGDDFYINAASNCSNAASKTYTFKGTAAAPNRIFSCSGITNNPPQSADLGVGAQVTTTGNSNLLVRGYLYAYGVIFNCGTGANAASITLAGTLAEQTYDSCMMKLLSTGSSTFVNTSGNNVGSRVTFINTPVFFNGGINSSLSISDGAFIWRDTPNAIQGAQNNLSILFLLQGGNAGFILCDGVDFVGGTGLAAGKSFTGTSTLAGFIMQMVDCKTNTGMLINRPSAGQTIIDQIVTDSGATNYKQQRDMYQGTLTADTTRFNNATDGTTPISWQVVTTVNCKPQSPFECFGISRKVLAGTYAASKIFITSSVPLLKTNDVWVELKYLGASYALGSPATSFGAGSGSATLPQLPQGSKPDTIPTASPVWGTGSLGYDYQLSIPSFTTAVDGEVWFVVKVGKSSLTVNIDPNATVA